MWIIVFFNFFRAMWKENVNRNPAYYSNIHKRLLRMFRKITVYYNVYKHLTNGPKQTICHIIIPCRCDSSKYDFTRTLRNRITLFSHFLTALFFARNKIVQTLITTSLPRWGFRDRPFRYTRPRRTSRSDAVRAPDTRTKGWSRSRNL